MWKRRNSVALCGLATAFLVQIWVLATGQSTNASSWKTLSGNDPVVIARGGFSGTFPDSSYAAYSFALTAGSSNTVLLCDVQLTKDGVPICLPSITLDNCTSIAGIYPKGKKQYDVNGVMTAGWFSVDYKYSDLSQIYLTQPIWSRTEKFDYTGYPILSVTDLKSQVNPPSLWLNMQYPSFYEQHGLNMRNYTISLDKQVIINYISSPEIGFLKGISNRVSNKTKLIFRFPSDTLKEPSTNQTYASLRHNLTYIKTFASGILVPKGYIWRVTKDNYLQNSTTLVTDAHKSGLEVYAADFANDNLFSYNYSYDPLSEYLQFIDNSDFSVDGVLTDYPITPTSAIGCFKDLNTSNMDHGKPLIISHNGASGDYPDCTDVGYRKAVADGADVIDCTVQVTKDGVFICMSSINLMDVTTVLQSQFSSRTSIIPALKKTPGIFTFNLTWDEISKSLKPVISAPQSEYYITRNPRNKNLGKFLKLSDFLAFAKDKDLLGVLLILEDVAFIQETLGFDVISAVTTTVSESGYSNQTSRQVHVLSSNSSVLTKLRQDFKYKLIYQVEKNIRDASSASVADIKRFADAVAIHKYSVYPVDRNFITNQTNFVNRLQSAGLEVYGYGFMNEFVSIAWDFFADATVELNTYFQGARIDGFITDFPATARRYKRSRCLNAGNDTPNYFKPVEVGGLMQLIITPAQPPALPPPPILNPSDVIEPPLPAVPSKNQGNATVDQNGSGPSTQPSHGSQGSQGSRTAASIFLLVILVFATVLLV